MKDIERHLSALKVPKEILDLVKFTINNMSQALSESNKSIKNLTQNF